MHNDPETFFNVIIPSDIEPKSGEVHTAKALSLFEHPYKVIESFRKEFEYEKLPLPKRYDTATLLRYVALHEGKTKSPRKSFSTRLSSYALSVRETFNLPVYWQLPLEVLILSDTLVVPSDQFITIVAYDPKRPEIYFSQIRLLEAQVDKPILLAIYRRPNTEHDLIMAIKKSWPVLRKVSKNLKRTRKIHADSKVTFWGRFAYMYKLARPSDKWKVIVDAASKAKETRPDLPEPPETNQDFIIAFKRYKQLIREQLITST